MLRCSVRAGHAGRADPQDPLSGAPFGVPRGGGHLKRASRFSKFLNFSSAWPYKSTLIQRPLGFRAASKLGFRVEHAYAAFAGRLVQWQDRGLQNRRPGFDSLGARHIPANQR